MKRWMSSFARSAFVPLLVSYLFVGTCGGGRWGFVLRVKAGKVAVTAGWCEAAPEPVAPTATRAGPTGS